MADKDTKTIEGIIEQARTNNRGFVQGASELGKKLQEIQDNAKLAIANRNAQAITDGTKNNNSSNMNKPSRTGKSRTLIGLAKLQGFMGSEKKPTNKQMLS